MTLRLEYWSVEPRAIAALTAVNTLLDASAVGAILINLIYLRISQINGCAYCMDLHAADLRKAGETDARIESLTAWHDSPLYSDRERAALAWAEAVTRIEGNPPPDAVWDTLRTHFDDKEAIDVTYAAALMNAWNRIAIAFRHEPDGTR